jgi:hypothetical protein
LDQRLKRIDYLITEAEDLAIIRLAVSQVAEGVVEGYRREAIVWPVGIDKPVVQRVELGALVGSEVVKDVLGG